MKPAQTTYDEDKLRFELIRDEGKRLKPYQDSLGNWTVGIGHLMPPNTNRAAISEQQCLAYFHEDIKDAEKKLSAIFPHWRKLSDVRQRALLNLTFNLGYKLKQFQRFLGSMEFGDYASAAKELKDSKWFRQVGLRGPRIIHMIETDSEWDGE